MAATLLISPYHKVEFLIYNISLFIRCILRYHVGLVDTFVKILTPLIMLTRIVMLLLLQKH